LLTDFHLHDGLDHSMKLDWVKPALPAAQPVTQDSLETGGSRLWTALQAVGLPKTFDQEGGGSFPTHLNFEVSA
jgi:hypothetical protein